MTQTRVVDVGGIRLVVAEAGAGGRPLLLLHGFTGAKEDFTEWLEPLAALGWHAVAPDHRGHGESDKPDGVDAYSMAIIASDGLALADALGFDRFVLLGHSMGGFVAQRMAFAAPWRLQGLVLMDTGHGPVEGLDPEPVELAGQIALDQGMDVLADLMTSVRSPLETPAHRRVVEERPGYEEFGDRKLRASAPGLYAAVSRELVTCEDTLERLATLDPTPPTLVVVGEQDAPFVGSAKRMADAVAGATLAVIPDAGHSPQFESPAAWWDVVSTFLAGLETA